MINIIKYLYIYTIHFIYVLLYAFFTRKNHIIETNHIYLFYLKYKNN